ncbi:MAG: pyridoxal phosphate-dependent aminotransferase [Lentimicrobiaceae bacterium]|jgi:aspartate aminotransferase|nr:pyridoxal phosphate-dependent aminotransferase [Lentimicrobiaceae bacterium]MBT3453676.1 pyridoxal phosphate-dependent aminotransferase [Lentimicrobiaceae bacterium]MBT3818239.1 pyridoxal phosphate-dependent aminotransferase [Lentimicrobiaceae bacterium]MBT4061785.1 pyridoxal phosphate-dependent aminotransferase [Lentimicrobiaceae bacterium]MBT4190963.1 pyridoxal phosphate-dependent aminotransferase [Lentimicrobiaceae bacterium]
MLKISQKGRSMPESPIRKLVPFAEGAKKRGLYVHHLNIGQPDIETPEVALNAIHNFGDKVFEYSHSAGIASFREKLTEYYRSVNINVTADEIIVGAGASEALLFAFQSIMDPGDEVIIPEPFYANYNGFAKNGGVNIVPIFSSIETGFALPPIEDFVNNITPRTKAILVCNPNNPTGYLYSKEELDTLRDIVKKYDLYLIADEVYREFTYDGKKHFSCMNLSGIDNNVILIDSVSKRYSACGLRIGWLISKNKDVIASALKFAQARLSPPTLGQVAAEAALDTPDEYFSEVMAEYVARRNTVVEGINNIKDAFCPNPEGAFYVVAKLPIDDSDKFCRWLLEDFNYENQTIMLAPASGFYSSPGKGKDEVRISYVLNVPDLNKSIKILEEGLKVYPGRTN